jgi:glutaredoxin 3
MPEVVVYVRSWCPWCLRAATLLERKGVSYVEIDIEEQHEREAEMVQRAGGRTTVPQIFVDGEHVGGFDDLHAAELSGRLDRMLDSGERS